MPPLTGYKFTDQTNQLVNVEKMLDYAIFKALEDMLTTTKCCAMAMITLKFIGCVVGPFASHPFIRLRRKKRT